MPMNMEQTNGQFEFQVIGKFEIVAGLHLLHHMNTPLAHDIIGYEGGLYSLHIKVASLEYRIVHVLLAFGGEMLTKHIPEDMRTHASPF